MAAVTNEGILLEGGIEEGEEGGCRSPQKQKKMSCHVIKATVNLQIGLRKMKIVSVQEESAYKK